MAVRLTGLASGLDTDAIVQELVSAYQVKVDDLGRDKQNLEWKDEAWSDMNSDIYSFYTKQLGTMRYQKAYLKQTTSVSDSTKATVSASGSAVTGTQTLNILSLAKSGYITGGKLASSTLNTTTLETLYSGIKDDAGTATMSDTGTIKIMVGDTETTITLNSTDTVKEAIAQINNISGITASYDSKNQRIFVNANDSGTDNDIALIGGDESGIAMLQSLGIYVSSNKVNDVNDTYLSIAKKDTNGSLDETATKAYIAELKQLEADQTTLATANNTLISLQSSIETYREAVSTVAADTADADYYNAADSGLKAVLETAITATGTDSDDLDLDDLEEYLTTLRDISLSTTADDTIENFLTTKDADTVSTYNSVISKAMSILSQAATENENNAETYNAAYDTLKAFSTMISSAKSIQSQIGTTDPDEQEIIAEGVGAFAPDGTVDPSLLTLTNVLSDNAVYNLGYQIESIKTSISDAEAELEPYKDIISESEDDIYNGILMAISSSSFTYSNAESKGTDGAVVINAADAQIILNGASFTSDSNTMTINGLTITATGVTGTGEENAVSITTATDSSGVYDSIKSFLSAYNTVINKMNKAYNADSASDYQPLTDDEKDEMSDTEIEKWETKIKDAILRRDSTLGTTISLFHNSTQQSYYVLNGKAVTYSSKDGAYKYNGNVLTTEDGTNITTSAQLDKWASANGATKYNLSSFGIKTLGYLNAAENEEYAYHIDGDSDDGETGVNEDKLLTAIQTNPDDVSAFFAALFSDMYSSLTTAMQHTTLSSSFTIYNDKQIDSDIDDVEDDIETWQERLEDLEDEWYDKFSTMETALSELQSQQTALSNLLGTSS
jgi:flagellar hook-associated protein 2